MSRFPAKEPVFHNRVFYHYTTEEALKLILKEKSIHPSTRLDIDDLFYNKGLYLSHIPPALGSNTIVSQIFPQRKTKIETPLRCLKIEIRQELLCKLKSTKYGFLLVTPTDLKFDEDITCSEIKMY